MFVTHDVCIMICIYIFLSYVTTVYIAGYISGLLEKERKLQLADINLAVTGSRGTIATPPGVYAVGAILADLILAVWQEIRKSAKCNSPPAIRYIGVQVQGSSSHAPTLCH